MQHFYEKTFKIRNYQSKVASNGNPYINLDLVDPETGAVYEGSKIWDLANIMNPDEMSMLANITGKTQEYNGKEQIVVNRLEFLPEVEDPEILREQEERMRYLESRIGEIQDQDIKRLVITIYEESKEAFTTHAAAVKFHHNERYGLLIHTVEMLKIAEALIASQKMSVNKDYVIAGIILHDFGKIEEIKVDVLSNEKTFLGNMLGHINIIALKVQELLVRLGMDLNDEKFAILQNIILSHHGAYEWGSNVLPATVEAWIVHLADYSSSRLNMIAKEFEVTLDGNFTTNIYPLGNVSIYKHE